MDANENEGKNGVVEERDEPRFFIILREFEFEVYVIEETGEENDTCG